jgi:hypothetical protein
MGSKLKLYRVGDMDYYDAPSGVSRKCKVIEISRSKISAVSRKASYHVENTRA